MTLPWFRVDTGLASHDKILALLDDGAPPALRWRAAFSYVCSIGWSVDNGTDGKIPRAALPFVHATSSTARLLVTYDLWDLNGNGWEIHNYANRQPLAHVVEADHETRREAGRRAACLRWHGPECWVEGEGCSRA